MISHYASLGWATIRVHPLSKRPVEHDWSQRPPATPDQFLPGENVGVLLGTPSGGLVDVDLDCPEAVQLAPLYLPATATFGRPSSPRSHWVYRCTTTTRKPPRAQIELRSTGGQTVFPPSIHESGEQIAWHDWPEGGPLELTEDQLLSAWGRLGCATILARCWADVQRTHDAHHTMLALAGALYHAGWPEADAAAVLLPAAELAGGPDSGHRAQAIADTYDDHDRHRWGWPKVAEFLGPLDAKALERMADLVPATPRAAAASGVVFGALTDLGNVERFWASAGEDLMCVPGIGWLQWDATRWAPLRSPMGLVIRSVRSLGAAAAQAGDAVAAKWALRSEAAGKLNAVVDLAAQLDVRYSAAQLDADPYILNTPSGIVDLRTGELHPHRRDVLATKIAGVPYDPQAECPRFVRFLSEIFRADQDLVLYMIRYLGSSLTGDVRDQVFQIWYGTGANGKSTLVEVMLHILGDYAQKMTSDLLTQQGRSGSGPNPELARIRGVRFSAGVETREGARWNEQLIKELTGGDRVVARHLHKEPIEFSPTWKLALAVNHRPTVRGTDAGIWRRIHLVPFTREFLGADRDYGLLDYLRDHEGPGILRLLVEGCRAWLGIGLQAPSSVAAAVQSYRDGQDTIGAFLAECTEAGPDYVTQRSALYRTYRQWCADGGEFCHGKQTVSRILEERGLRTARVRGHVQWVGVRVISP